MKRTIAAAALCATFGVTDAAAQAFDVHSHIIVPEYAGTLEAHGAELEEAFPLPSWDAARHVAFMDSAGISTAVLTMPAPQPYFGDAAECARCIRLVNEAAARAKREYPAVLVLRVVAAARRALRHPRGRLRARHAEGRQGAVTSRGANPSGKCRTAVRHETRTRLAKNMKRMMATLEPIGVQPPNTRPENKTGTGHSLRQADGKLRTKA